MSAERARIEVLPEAQPGEDVEEEALARSVTALFQKVVSLSSSIPDDLAGITAAAETPGALADLVAASLPNLDGPARQGLLETLVVKERLVPVTMVPFAVDPGGDYFFVDTTTTDGHVYIYRHDTAHENLRSLGCGFDEFLASLVEEAP